MKKNYGFPIPKRRTNFIEWVNYTPHLSKLGAAYHHYLLQGFTKVVNVYEELHKLVALITNDDEHYRKVSDMAWELSCQGKLFKYVQKIISECDGNIEYMLDKLMQDKDEAKAEPQLESHYDAIADKLKQAIDKTEIIPLRNYENKLYLKYLGDSSVRTGKGYFKQISTNYLANRSDWRDMYVPNSSYYEDAYTLYRRRLGFPSLDETDHTPDRWISTFNTELIRGSMLRARSSTFGGYPYLRNMADFVSDDESDNTTYFQLYNDLAIMYLYLRPHEKLALNPNFIALERVQPGGYELHDEELTKKDNKQRFVQAQSAMISHAYKFLVDATNAYCKAIIPTYFSDKFGEEAVSESMKRFVKISCGKEVLSENSELMNYCVVGTDFTNYDASQDAAMSNDVLYNTWRSITPKWMTEWLIDPYVKITYAKNRILVPYYGLIQTTGVKSGMADTNQCDTHNCIFIDAYELVYWNNKYNQKHMSYDAMLNLLDKSMANGDDRFKLTPFGADVIEEADRELGVIAQKSKQEVASISSKLKDLNVTYLKTIIVFNPDTNDLVRTDSIAKLILARIHPESIPQVNHEHSLVCDFFMSAARSSESPNLYILVDFMWTYLPLFQQLVKQELSFTQLLAGCVMEQMEALSIQRGKKWMRRKGMDYNLVLESMNTKYGYGPEGYRGEAGSITQTGFEKLPQVRAIMDLAHDRYSNGIIGSTFA